MANLDAMLTCPHCGHQPHEVMPTDRCIVVYDCPACARRLSPKGTAVCFAPTLIVPALPSKTQSLELVNLVEGHSFLETACTYRRARLHFSGGGVAIVVRVT